MSKYHFHLFDLAETSLGGKKRKRGKHSGKVISAPLKSKEKEVGQKEEHVGCNTFNVCQRDTRHPSYLA